MTNFLDGPAKGVRLVLSRAPIMLRVVQDKDGKWDALDKVDDVAAHDEKIFVYQLERAGPTVFIDVRDSKTGKRTGGMFAAGEYKFLPDQPKDAEIRTRKAWEKWCNDNKERLLVGRNYKAAD
jgi:hypothetical protein